MTSSSPIRLPAPPPEPPTRPIPVLIVLAPVVSSIVIYAITGMAMALAFAALGPLIGIASWAEGARAARRSRRRGRRELAAKLETASQAVEERRAEVLAARRRRDPLLADLLDGARPRPVAAPGPDDPIPWALGAAEQPSGIRTEGGGAHPDLEELAARAATIEGCPLAIEAPRLALRGRPASRASVARALVLGGVARGLSEDAVLRRLVELDPDGPAAPAGCPELVLDEPSPGLARFVDDDGETVLEPDRASAIEQARWLAARGGTTERPEAARGALELPPPRDDRRLAAAFGVGEAGPVEIDLVGDGPHAVVGGTTGSGKSELLLAWTTALAAAYPPERFAFLALDFKGGATFDPLAELPHCAGILTDLDSGGEVARAVTGLRAELRRRERLLRDARAKSLADLDEGPPRLVVIVDEFQALLGASPELHDAFADLASRGRSLGIHLVLCTQRPASAVRDALLANCSIRCCLRVTSGPESQAVLGSAIAASIPPADRGRAYLDLGAGPVPVQALRAAPDAVAEVAGRWQGRARARTVVAPPLPSVLEPDAVEGLGEGGAFALGDEPDAQRRPLIRLEPGEHLAVVGGPRSGRSCALAAIAQAVGEAARPIPLGSAPGTAWARLEQAEDAARRGAPTLLLADDLDALLRTLDEPRRHELAERLARLLRAGGGHLRAVLAVDRLAPPWSGLVALADRTLVLGTRSKQDHLMAGGDPGTWRQDAPPGRGSIAGMPVQVMLAEPLAAGRKEPIAVQAGEGPIAVVTSRPAAEEELRAAGWSVVPVAQAESQPAPAPAGPEQSPGPGAELARRAIVGDVEAWNRRHGSLAEASRLAPVVLDGVAVGELRALLRGAPTLAPVDDPLRECILRTPDGRQRMARWPGAAPGAG